MPQMMPMLWLFIFVYSLIIFMILYILINFYKLYTFPFMMVSKKNFPLKWTWKW
uniref:ATP synthase F0 subunit 8 n=1 Tax=Tapinoma ibericum TaxID=2005328 RepID=UPI002176C5FC|nr:ATP synthase F0 subunit 8 [Tapinoma ibericum]UUF93595.1 ATP synthase F0 subunit 8 [Tapinoma ibericum]